MSPDLIQSAAYRLFTFNHQDADADTLRATWDRDIELRAFWVRQVWVVLNVVEAA